MKHCLLTSNVIGRLCGLMLAGVLVIGLARSASAAGTAAGTTITNAASVDYQVNSISQTQITSADATFLVDRKVDLTVVTNESAVVNVTPGSSGNVIAFTLTNTGNATFDYIVTAEALNGIAAKFGGTDNIDASPAPSVYVEEGTTVGYQSGVDLAGPVNDLAADGTIVVYIVASFATGLSDNDIASYYLLAEAREASDGSGLTADTGGDQAGVMEDLFAEGDGPATGDVSRDAKHSDFADYQVQAASLTVTKTSVVISDPINSTTSPLAIPGAIIEYTITVSNAAGAETATSISITDSLNTEIATNSTLAFNADTYASGYGIRVTAPNINGGSALDLTNASGDDAGDWNITATNTVTVTGIQLLATESATVVFQVTVQ